MLVTILAMIALVLAISYWLFREAIYGKPANRWQRADANLAIYEERTSAIDENEATLETADEAKRLLLADAADAKHESKNESSKPFIGIVSVVFVSILGVLGYLYWGDPFAASLDTIAQRLQVATQMEAGPKKITELDTIIDLLERRNRSRRGNSASATYLTHMYFLNGDYDSVVETHRKAEELGRTSLNSDVERIRAEFVLNNGLMNDDIKRISNRIEEVDPGNPIVMQTYGLDAWRLRDFPKARYYFERALQHDEEISPASTAILEELIHRTNAQLPAHHIAVVVNVNIASLEFANTWLIVYVRSTNLLQPIALVKRPFARAEQYSLVLDDAVTTANSYSLSEQQKVQVIARLSRSSSLLTEDTIIEVQSRWVDPRDAPNLTLTLDPQKPVLKTFTAVVELAEHITVNEGEFVYIFGAGIDENDSPLLAKKISVTELPTALMLGTEDFTLPTSEFPDEGLNLFARLSRTGNTTRQTGDSESKSVLVKAGDTVRLVIDQPVSETSEH